MTKRPKPGIYHSVHMGHGDLNGFRAGRGCSLHPTVITLTITGRDPAEQMTITALSLSVLLANEVRLKLTQLFLV